MKNVTDKATYATIFMAGDIDRAKHACAHYCKDAGLCVTVTPTEFIYTGGREQGFAIGLINYPRFPSTEKEVYQTAKGLAAHLLVDQAQDSALVQTPTEVCWLTTRDATVMRGDR